MARRRLAVALLLRGQEQVEVDGIRRALGDPDLDRIPAHVTLVPPVNVREAEMPVVLSILHAAGERSLTFEVGPASTFLPVSPTLYLVVGGDIDSLSRVRERLRVGPFDRPDPLPFVPHVTLLNPGETDALERARLVLARYRVPVSIDRVDLLEEVDHVWRSIADAVLAAPATVGRGSLPLQLLESTQLDPEARAFADAVWRVHDEDTFGEGTRWSRAPFALTARREGRVVGIATGWTAAGVAFLSELLVAPDARRQGIGSHLLAAFEALGSQRGCPRFALRTDEGSPAQAFYEARGWAVEARFSPWLAGHDFVQLRR